MTATHGRPTQPASVGAGVQRSESSTRVRGSNGSSGVPARRFTGCRSRRAAPAAQRSVNPPATGSRGREPGRRDLEMRFRRFTRRREPEGMAGQAVRSGEGWSRALERALRGKSPRPMEGVPDRPRPAPFTRVGQRTISAVFEAKRSARAGALRRRSDRDVRGTAAHNAMGNNKPFGLLSMEEGLRPTEANRSDVRQAIPRLRARHERDDASGTDEARVLVRRT